MRRILSLIGAALTFAGCSSPTAPSSGDQSANAAKAKSALGAVAKASTGRANGRLSAN
jgi:PBP1b-binding outer membrane lipoprotein LpoB